jgi:hypothetical protein
MNPAMLAAVAAAKEKATQHKEQKADEHERAVAAGIPVALPWYRSPGRMIAWIVLGLIVLSVARGVIGELVGFPDLGIDIPAPLSAEDKYRLDQPVPGEIVRVEPIAIECRATVDAVVPLALTKDVRYSVFGAGLFTRSEHGFYTAYGDVDVCVGIDNTRITGTEDFGWNVQVDAADIEFRRPRVDTIRSAQSWELHTDWGWVPGVDGNDDAGTDASALAQLFIGSSECMEAAWDATVFSVVESYRYQAQQQGVDPALVEVTINGTPNFDQYVDSYMENYDAATIEWIENLREEYGFTETNPGDDDYRPVECRLHESLVQPIPLETPTTTSVAAPATTFSNELELQA